MSRPALARRRRATLAAGLRWLFDTEQPAGAVQQHHGVGLPPVGNRRFGFCPAGGDSRAVVTVAVANVEWRLQRGEQVSANPIRPTELDDLTTELASLGAEVVHTWNGHPGTTGSLALARPAHPSLLAAVDRYRAGCPTHPGHGSDKGVFCQCGWYAAGNDLVIQPDVNDERVTQV